MIRFTHEHIKRSYIYSIRFIQCLIYYHFVPVLRIGRYALNLIQITLKMTIYLIWFRIFSHTISPFIFSAHYSFPHFTADIFSISIVRLYAIRDMSVKCIREIRTAFVTSIKLESAKFFFKFRLFTPIYYLKSVIMNFYKIMPSGTV